jgi:hypothetical protein
MPNGDSFGQSGGETLMNAIQFVREVANRTYGDERRQKR